MRWTTNRAARRSLAVATLAVLGWAIAGAGSAGAVTEVSDLGWWTRSPLSSAPDGGFAVGAAPDGVTSVAAMRMDLGGGVDTLVLEVQPTADAVALASLEVCITPGTWSAAAPGPLDDAPLTACASDSVPFAPAGEAWRADVSSLVNGTSGIVSLGVVPTPGSGTVPFEVTFEAPAVRSTGGTAGAPAPPSAPSPTPSPSPTPAATPSVSPSPPPVRIAPSVAPAVTPAAPAAPAGPAAPAAPPVAEADDDGAASTVELATSGLLGDTETSAPRWGEAFVLVLIGLGVGAAVYATSKVSAVRAARGVSAATS